MKLLYGRDKEVAAWVCRQINLSFLNLGPFTAIGIARNYDVIGGAIFNNQHLDISGKPLYIEITFATIDKRWANRVIVHTILAYPFCQLKVKRLQATVAKRDMQTRSFLEHLGFKLEGIGRKAWPQGGDACLYSLLAHEFFSSKWYISGQKRTISSGSTRSKHNGTSSDSQQSANCSL